MREFYETKTAQSSLPIPRKAVSWPTLSVKFAEKIATQEQHLRDPRIRRINKRTEGKFGGYREPRDQQIAFLIKNRRTHRSCSPRIDRSTQLWHRPISDLLLSRDDD